MNNRYNLLKVHNYVVLKPKHSCFYATPLDLLLKDLGVERLIMTGVSSDQCVLYTAADARMHEYETVIPRDCVATQSAQRNDRVIEYFAEALNIRTPPSAEIELAAKQ